MNLIALLIAIIPASLLFNVSLFIKSEVEVKASMEKHAKIILEDDKIHALSIGIYKDGQRFIGHFGELDPGKGNAPSDETLYEIASVSKTFIGTLVAQAVIEKKLSLDHDIRKYLNDEYPNLEYQGHPITIRNLVTHTSRLPKFLPVEINELMQGGFTEELPFQVSEIEENYTRKKFFQDLKEITIDTIPGIVYAYSNADTELMAHILENVYHKEIDQLIQEKICGPVHMPATKINLTPSEKTNLANGYGQTLRIMPQIGLSLWGAGGGVKSNMHDLLNYMELQLYDKTAAVRASHQVLFEQDGDKIGYYWPIREDEEDGLYYSHHGGAFGTQNWMFILPKHHMAISVITNQSDIDTAGKLFTVVAGILDDLRSS